MSTLSTTENNDTLPSMMVEIEADMEYISVTSQLNGTVAGRKQKYRTFDVANVFFGNAKEDTGIIPPVVRYLSPDYRGCIIERQPTRHVIEMKDGQKFEDGKTHSFDIPVPWTTYTLGFDTDGSFSQKFVGIHFSIGFRQSQIWTPEDQLHSPYTPNSYYNGQLCMSSTITNELKKCRNISEAIGTVIASYWGSEGNMDVSDPYLYSMPDEIKAKADKRSNKNDSVTLRLLKCYEELEKLSIEECLELTLVPTRQTTVATRIQFLNSIAGSTTLSRDKAAKVDPKRALTNYVGLITHGCTSY